MRIVSGKYGGRKIEVPKGDSIRPTSDKVRGAIFNILVSRGAVSGANVLDAFCGTGAMGLEALSRGADSCVFMDIHKPSLDVTRQNIMNLGAVAMSQILQKN
ncbi:MAG: RsmD family RNA methyltransferase, partial [Alphaproteobacteria bacterium]